MGGRTSPIMTCEEAQPPKSRTVPINGRPMRPFIGLSFRVRVVILEPTLLAWAIPKQRSDMSPRIIDAGCLWGTPQGHALAILISRFQVEARLSRTVYHALIRVVSAVEH